MTLGRKNKVLDRVVSPKKTKKEKKRKKNDDNNNKENKRKFFSKKSRILVRMMVKSFLVSFISFVKKNLKVYQ